jgi:ABC-2 type transport system permease protein
MITPKILAHNISHTLHTARVFWALIVRDLNVYASDFKRYLINYTLSFPLIYSFAFAYIQAQVFFGKQGPRLGSIMFAGNIIIPILVVTYKQAIELLFDLENERFVDYQMSVLSARLIILERIVFTTFFTFIMTLPFYPVAKLFLGSYFITSNASIMGALAVLFAGSFCCAGYHHYATMLMKNTSQLGTLWSRVNHPLISFGGFWVPLYIMSAYAPWFGKLALLNPLIYISEGLRTAIIGGPEFLPLKVCVPALLGFGIVFLAFTWRSFKQRVDPL